MTQMNKDLIGLLMKHWDYLKTAIKKWNIMSTYMCHTQAQTHAHTHTHIHEGYRHMHVTTTKEKEAEKTGVHENIWREEKEGENEIILNYSIEKTF